MNTVTAAPPPIEKSVLIKALRCVSPTAAKRELLNYSGSEGYNVKNILPRSWLKRHYSDSDSSSDSDSGSGHDSVSNRSVSEQPSPVVYEDQWFLIELTDSGLKISEILTDLKKEQPLVRLAGTGFSLIDSSLFVFGGMDIRGKGGRKHYYGDIQRLDIRNKADSWKHCNSLQFEFNNGNSAVFGQYIYMFSPLGGNRDKNGKIVSQWEYFAYVYDTIKQEGYLIRSPKLMCHDPEVYVPLEGRGMLLSKPSRSGKFYLHDPVQNCWQSCENYQPLPSGIEGPHSVLNGVLYFCDTEDGELNGSYYELYAYDCYKGRLLYKIFLPKLSKNASKFDLDDLVLYPEHLVALSDSMICFLWNCDGYLFCASVLVSSGPVPSAELLGVRCFLTDVDEISSCLPMDASLGKIMKNSKPMEKTRQKTMNQVQSKMNLPVFPISKRVLNQSRKKKVKRRRVMDGPDEG